MKHIFVTFLAAFILSVALLSCDKEGQSTEHIHSYGAWSVIATPTCVREGSESRFCYCGESQTRAIPPTGLHNYGTDNKCTVCSKPFLHTEGLLFEETADGLGYAIKRAIDTAEVTVPPYHNGKPVIAVKDGAFCDLKSVSAVILPDGILEIGEGAFSGCDSLVSVSIPGGVSRISAKTFENCTSLETLELPESVKEIGSMAFLGCTNLRCVTGGSLMTLAADAFDGCESLVTLPHVHSLGEWKPLTPADCEHDGTLGHYLCTECGAAFDSRGDLIADIVVPALGHELGKWIHAIAPDCTNDGVLGHYSCNTCGENFDKNKFMLESVTITSEGHSFGEWLETLAPDCISAGCERRDCKNCDHYEERKVDALGHVLGDWTAVGEGEERRDCAECDYFETRRM